MCQELQLLTAVVVIVYNFVAREFELEMVCVIE